MSGKPDTVDLDSEDEEERRLAEVMSGKITAVNDSKTTPDGLDQILANTSSGLNPPHITATRAVGPKLGYSSFHHHTRPTAPPPTAHGSSSLDEQQNLIGGGGAGLAQKRIWTKFGDETRNVEVREAAIPDNYTCHRCGARGQHFVVDCPTNADDNYFRRRYAAGIPREFLKPITEEDLKYLDSTDQVFVIEDNQLVVLRRVSDEEKIKKLGGESDDQRFQKYFGTGPNEQERLRFHRALRREKERVAALRLKEKNLRLRNQIQLKLPPRPPEHWAVQRVQLTCDLALSGSSGANIFEVKEELSAMTRGDTNANLKEPASLKTHLLNNPHMTRCCGRTYCLDCITRHVQEGYSREGAGAGPLCPGCGHSLDLESLMPDHDVRELLAVILQGKERVDIVKEETLKLERKIQSKRQRLEQLSTAPTYFDQQRLQEQGNVEDMESLPLTESIKEALASTKAQAEKLKREETLSRKLTEERLRREREAEAFKSRTKKDVLVKVPAGTIDPLTLLDGKDPLSLKIIKMYNTCGDDVGGRAA